MPAAKVDHEALMTRLTDVFQRYGFDGASLSRISKATGLQRASLYHRFPGGKEEMARAVLERIDEQFLDDILAPLGETGDPAARLKKVAERLRRFYEDGERACLLELMSVDESVTGLRRHVERSMTAWLDTFVRIARESGATPAAARLRAERALVDIQGSLVLTRALGETRPFLRALKDLPATLLEPAGR